MAAAKKRQAEAWKPPAGDQPEHEYRMNFGKHSGGKGKTIGEVMADDPQYFRHLLSGDSNMLDSKPDLKQALEKAGILAALMSERPRAKAEHAARVVARDEKDKGQGVRLHPEVGKLRQLQMIEASEIIAQGIYDGGMAEALALASQGEPAPPPRNAECTLPQPGCGCPIAPCVETLRTSGQAVRIRICRARVCQSCGRW